MSNFPHENSESVSNARKLRLFNRAGHQFGVFEDQIATIANWRDPTPLPHAPDPILGVVGVQGRMMTVLDLALMPGTNLVDVASPHDERRIIALRGDEQLALAVDVLGETVEIAVNYFVNNSTSGLLLWSLTHDGEDISIVNVKGLFPTAIQGRDRRRRRF